MFKRGHVENVIVLVVLVIAVIGVYFSLIPGRSTSGMSLVPVEKYGDPSKDILLCQQDCYQELRLTGSSLKACVSECQGSVNDQITGNFAVPAVAYSDVSDSGNLLTGHFAIPSAKEYGGAIRGIAAPGTRAFPAGRAYELPEQACYTCSCLAQGITASDRAAAERVCTDNCGGTIAEEVVIGPCS